MNSLMQRFAPPAAVLGIALYLGWPPSKSVDYGSDVVRAKAVRWRADDLEHPPQVTAQTDPFREVLVATAEKVVEPDTGKLVAPMGPTGPLPSELQEGLRVDGIAMIGGRRWAIINGRPRLPGDQVKTADANRFLCEILSVGSDHAVVSCEQTIAKLRPKRKRSRRVASAGSAGSSGSAEAIEPTTATGLPAASVPPPPGV